MQMEDISINPKDMRIIAELSGYSVSYVRQVLKPHHTQMKRENARIEEAMRLYYQAKEEIKAQVKMVEIRGPGRTVVHD